jgi:hypothetical protein
MEGGTSLPILVNDGNDGSPNAHRVTVITKSADVAYNTVYVLQLILPQTRSQTRSTT